MPLMMSTSREQRLAVRKSMLEMTARRQRLGSGSDLRELMHQPKRHERWWDEAARRLQRAGVEFAVGGAVGANVYMPERHTEGLDLVVEAGSAMPANRAFLGPDTICLDTPVFYEDMGCIVWGADRRRHKVSVIILPRAWGRDAVNAAQDNHLVGGLPTLTLPYAVAAKLISAKPQDSADIARMLGGAGDEVVEDVRSVVRQIRPNDAGDLDGLIASGRLEFGEA